MTLEQTTNPTSIPLPGLGYSPITNLYGQQLAPQGPIANLLSQLGPFSPYAVNPQLGLQGPLGYGQQLAPQAPIASLLSQLAPFSPYAANPQFGPQGPLGSIHGQFGALQPFMANQQLPPQIVSLLSQLAYLQPSFAGVQPFGGQQFGLQNPILSQLAQLLPILAASQQVGAHHMGNPWGQITPQAYLNPYQAYGGAVRPW